MAIEKQLHGDRHPTVAQALVNLGNSQIKLDRYSEAESYFRQALDIDQSWYGPEHPAAADIETYVALALSLEKRAPEAQTVLRHSLAVFENTYGKAPNSNVAMVYGQLGRVDDTLGYLDAAAGDFRKAADIYAAVYGPNHSFVAIELANLADIYRERKQYERAEQVYRDVVRRLTAAPSTDPLDIGVAQIKLGDVLAREKRYQEAETNLLAGYETLKKQSPTAVSLRAAREDLIAVYVALNMPEKAVRFRAELAPPAR
jgi:serine/threonine-protein kinase